MKKYIEENFGGNEKQNAEGLKSKGCGGVK